MGAERTFSIVLGTITVAISAFAIFLMLQMGGSSRSQGGRFYVAVGALVVFAVVDSQIKRFVHRFAPFTIGTSEPERRYALVSLVLGLLTAVTLLAAAWLLP